MMQLVPLDHGAMIDRSKMPQVDMKQLPDLLVYLGKRGINFRAGVSEPIKLRLHQEVDVAKAMAIPDFVLRIPVMLSSGLYVLDGDHRAYRHYVDKTLVPFIQLEASFTRAVKALLEFPATFTLPAS